MVSIGSSQNKITIFENIQSLLNVIVQETNLYGLFNVYLVTNEIVV